MLRNARQEEEKKRPPRLSAKSLVSPFPPFFRRSLHFPQFPPTKKEGFFFAPTKKTLFALRLRQKKEAGEREKSDATLRTLRVRISRLGKGAR